MAFIFLLPMYSIMRYIQRMKKATSFRLSERAMELLQRLSDALGVSLTAILELAIRELAKKHNVRE